LWVVVGIEQPGIDNSTIVECMDLVKLCDLRQILLRNENEEFNSSSDENEDFDLMILRMQRCKLFWHCIYYFTDNSLPFDFILPYEDTENI